VRAAGAVGDGIWASGKGAFGASRAHKWSRERATVAGLARVALGPPGQAASSCSSADLRRTRLPGRPTSVDYGQAAAAGSRPAEARAQRVMPARDATLCRSDAGRLARTEPLSGAMIAARLDIEPGRSRLDGLAVGVSWSAWPGTIRKEALMTRSTRMPVHWGARAPARWGRTQ
jgi:hypothetical protein